ncbi:hypothetical protein HNR30_001914 [Nonomuraea soli]|uniref:Uncharacterized protein n=1 Tax=Nonomuraea soli TaxID=1032476 RepID=A0A7W0HP70_9ACTN|nr:hypothetical protein [Nonomuraea soli]MBA2890573.1 hypothetical protein [Nonomuraea soli]
MTPARCGWARSSASRKQTISQPSAAAALTPRLRLRPGPRLSGASTTRIRSPVQLLTS